MKHTERNSARNFIRLIQYIYTSCSVCLLSRSRCKRFALRSMCLVHSPIHKHCSNHMYIFGPHSRHSMSTIRDSHAAHLSSVQAIRCICTTFIYFALCAERQQLLFQLQSTPRTLDSSLGWEQMCKCITFNIYTYIDSCVGQHEHGRIHWYGLIYRFNLFGQFMLPLGDRLCAPHSLPHLPGPLSNIFTGQANESCSVCTLTASIAECHCFSLLHCVALFSFCVLSWDRLRVLQFRDKWVF